MPRARVADEEPWKAVGISVYTLFFSYGGWYYRYLW